jgi:hypothetical protein
MSKIVLQLNYKFNTSPKDHTALNTGVVDSIAAVPGLIWKIWLMNETTHEAGGIYLFESREAAEAFLNSPGLTGFVTHPSISAVSTKLSGIVESLSLITRGPLTVAEPS